MKRSGSISRAALICLFFTALFAFSACSATKDGVSLKNENALKKYADEKCPACTFVKYETEQYSHKAYFTDDKCGFEFTVSSSVNEQYFDGAKAGYDERTENGWYFAYYNYLLDKIKPETDKLENQYGFKIKRETHTAPTLILFNLRTDKTLEQIREGMKKLGELVKQADVHEQYGGFEIRARDNSNEYGKEFAFYRFKDGITGDMDNDWQAYKFMDHAEKQLGVTCTLVRSEKMKLSEIPGITILGEHDSGYLDKLTKVYYFTTPDGRLKLIADYRYPYPDYYITDAK